MASNSPEIESTIVAKYNLPRLQRTPKELDPKERKRQQNRIAQRTYRRNQKARLRALEAAAMGRPLMDASEIPVTRESSENQLWEFSVNDTLSSGLDFPSLDLPSSQIEALKEKDTIDPSLAEFSSSGDISSDQINLSRTALHRAISAGNEPIAKILLDQGADAKRQDENGQTALHLAAESGRKSLVSLLLNSNIDPNVKDSLGRTALFSAVQGDNEEVARLLSDASIDIDSRDSLEDVALHIAVDRGSESLTRLLLSYGANINA